MSLRATPILGRLVQLWLGMFPISMRQNRDPLLLWRQTVTIRPRQGLRYGDLLLRMVLDPAVQISLDGFRCRRGNPNENLARELFSLGEGIFSEKTARRWGLQVLISDAEVWESRHTPEAIGLDLVSRQPLVLPLPAPADKPIWRPFEMIRPASSTITAITRVSCAVFVSRSSTCNRRAAP